MRPNHTLLKIGEALDNTQKGSVVSQDLGKTLDTIYLHLLLQKAKAYKVLGSLLEVNFVCVYWYLKNESKENKKKKKELSPCIYAVLIKHTLYLLI